MLRTVGFVAVICWAGLASSAQAQVKLELKHTEGAQTTDLVTSKTHQILSINGMDVETTSEETVRVRSAIGTRKADGSLPIETKIESLRAQISLPGNMVLSFDSANPPDKKDESPLGFLLDVFKAVAGSSYTIILDKNDKVASVEGTQKVLDKATELNPMAAEMLRSRMDVEKIKHSHEQETDIFPTILVRPGDTWEKKEDNDIGGGQTLAFQRRYEYQGPVNKDGAMLEKIGSKALSVTYSMDPNASSPAKVTKSDLKVDSSEGTILFDRKLGRVVERSGKIKISGDMTLSIAGNELPTKLNLSMESSVKLEK